MTGNFTPPATQKAVVLGDQDKPIIKADAPCPRLSPDQVLVRTDAVALNPSDTKMRGGFAIPFGTLGADFAGTVLAVGSAVEDVAVGDRVCGAQNIMFKATPEQGAFAEYNVTRGRTWMKVPDSWTIEAAASLPVGVSTAGLAMKLLGIPLPGEPAVEPATVLVYGGSTATATIAMQLIRMAGCTPIATCSPKHFDLAKRNGAAEVFDYRDEGCAEKIRKYTKGNLKYALDCIVNVESTTACFKAIGRAGGNYVALDPFPVNAATRKMVKTAFVVGPLIFGEGCTWPEPYGREPSEEMRQFGVKLWQVAHDLAEQGKLQHHPLRIVDGGFEAIVDGLKLVAQGQVSGEKIVVRMT
ncbi:enoyl reductase [Colletotrichum truncatum]|uniref:Enoyl reductase n=1 Tax=Colletotrichum truncatum TaxID=5467 RepID=A0ACC3ZI69_COLTU|nr:enoyl reductase [Colletotrichum truncatum]KAF6785626.1 enoyl reductase [Colletotrichum truncatum]